MTRTTFPTVMLKLEQIETDPDNVFRHEDGDIARLTGVIQEYGFLSPVTVDAESVTTKGGIETYRLVGGEARLEGARAAGLTEIPATLATFESEDARTAAGIALNAHFGHFDDAALTQQLKELAESGFDLDMTALKPFELEDLLNDMGAMTTNWPEIMPTESHQFTVRYSDEDLPTLLRFMGRKDLPEARHIGDAILEGIRRSVSNAAGHPSHRIPDGRGH